MIVIKQVTHLNIGKLWLWTEIIWKFKLILLFQIQEKYTVGNREFGIDKHIIKYVVDTCAECVAEQKCQGGDNGEQCPQLNGGGPNQNWSSMIANMPDAKCIWFDKEGL